MAVEARRGCGYRKVGGLYMMGGRLSAPCCKLPIVLDVCPCCGMGVRLTRTWTWVDPTPWLAGECQAVGAGTFDCSLAVPERLKAPSDDKLRVGLLNVGAAFYKSPDDFAAEAAALGVSRRIQAVPRGFKLGEHWVLLAHPRLRQVFKVGDRTYSTEAEALEYIEAHASHADYLEREWVGGIFGMFKPTSIDKVMTESQYLALDEEEVEKLKRQGVTPFVVPDDDKDHQGSVYKEEVES